MGGSTSKVSAENISRQLMSVISNTNASALTSSQGVNSINLSGNCKIPSTGEINQRIEIVINSNILQQVSSDVSTQQNLTNKVKQISEAEAPNLSLSAGAESEAFTKLILDLSTAISTSISTSCSQSNSSLNDFNCKDFTEFAGKSKQEILGSFFYSCTQNLTTLIKAKQDLQNFIDQHSKAKVVDVIFKILIAIAIIMVIYFIGPSLGRMFSTSSSSKYSKINNDKLKTESVFSTKNILFILFLVTIIGIIILAIMKKF